MQHTEILTVFNNIDNLKTKHMDTYNRKLIKDNRDVSKIGLYILEEPLLHRTYFQVSMGQLDNYHDQFQFIEDNAQYLQDWWHVDQLTQFMKKPINFDDAYALAKSYVQSELPFLRRWGYVLFLTGLQKDKEKTSLILDLIHDDDAYYVQMAEAWLICDLAIFNPKVVLAWLEKTHLKYNITGKAVQKILDSFRISEEYKLAFKALRPYLKAQ